MATYATVSILSYDDDWFHRELTREKAEEALAASGCDCFLVRQRQGALVLSLIQHGELHHINIKSGPGWYELDEHYQAFSQLQELVDHYRTNLISNEISNLGIAYKRKGVKGTG